MKDGESAESKEKSNFSDFYFSSWEENTMKQTIPWMPLSANLFWLESSILTRTKRATNRNNAATNRKKYSVFSGENIPWRNIPGWNVPWEIFRGSIPRTGLLYNPENMQYYAPPGMVAVESYCGRIHEIVQLRNPTKRVQICEIV